MDNTIREALEQYAADLFAPEDAVLRAVRDEIERQELPAIHVRPEEGRMLQFLLTAIGAQRVVEIGTLAGYSGIWIARALPADGRLISLEREPERAALARAFFEQAGLGERVEVRAGEAAQALVALAAEGPFDAVFIDANKAGYPAYLDWALDNVRPGGLILAHNAFMRGRVIDPDQEDDPSVSGLRTFNERMASDPRLLGTIVPIGDGITAAVRLPG